MLTAAVLGFQRSGGIAGGVALGLVMARRSRSFTPWEGRDLERALKSAQRFKLSEDLAPFMPPEPRWFWARKDKDLYRSAVISLKQLDQLPGEERTKAIADLKLLLGA